MYPVNYYVASKTVFDNIKKLKRFEKELHRKTGVGYGNALEDTDALNDLMRLTMPNAYRIIASYIPVSDGQATLYFVEENYTEDEAEQFNERVQEWIGKLKEKEEEIYIYDDFGTTYSVDELVSSQLHLGEKEPNLVFEPLEPTVEKPVVVGDILDEKLAKVSKGGEQLLSTDTYVLTDPQSANYVKHFFDFLYNLPKTIRPKERYKEIALGQLIVDNFYVPFADVPRSYGVVNFYCNKLTELVYATIKEKKSVKGSDAPVFDADGKEVYEEKIIYNADGQPVYRFADIPEALALFRLLNEPSKKVPFKLYRLEHGNYHRAKREDVLKQVLHACEAYAETPEDFYNRYIHWLQGSLGEMMVANEETLLLPIDPNDYVGTTWQPRAMQFVPVEMEGKYYVIAEMVQDFNDETEE